MCGAHYTGESTEAQSEDRTCPVTSQKWWNQALSLSPSDASATLLGPGLLPPTPPRWEGLREGVGAHAEEGTPPAPQPLPRSSHPCTIDKGTP